MALVVGLITYDEEIKNRHFLSMIATFSERITKIQIANVGEQLFALWYLEFATSEL